MTKPCTVPGPTLTPDLIASLGVRTWLDHTTDGRQFAPLLLTHRPVDRNGEGIDVIEQRMHGVAEALGVLPPGPKLPDAGPRVFLQHSGMTLVHFDGTPNALRVPHSTRWSHIVAELGHVVLAVGLDPLSPQAYGAEIDRYIEATGDSGRIRFAAATVVTAQRGDRVNALP